MKIKDRFMQLPTLLFDQQNNAVIRSMIWVHPYSVESFERADVIFEDESGAEKRVIRTRIFTRSGCDHLVDLEMAVFMNTLETFMNKDDEPNPLSPSDPA